RTYEDHVIEYTFRRGWLDSLKVSRYKVALTRAMAAAPQLRLVRRLEMFDNAFEEEDEDTPGDDIPDEGYYPQLYPPPRCPYPGNVRTFILGEMLTPAEEDEADDGGISCHTEGDAAVGMIKLMPKVEELYLLAHRVDTDQLFSLKTLHRLRVLMV